MVYEEKCLFATLCTVRVHLMSPYRDHDPLADRPPPRYAVESDDDDDPAVPDLPVAFTFSTQQEIEKHLPLIVASGNAGIFLGSLLASLLVPSRVYANSIEVTVWIFLF